MAQQSLLSEFGEAMSNLMHGMVSLITTGSWHVQAAAEKARTAGALLDRVDQAAEEDGQHTLDAVNEILTQYYQLEDQAALQRTTFEGWQAKAKEAAAQAVKLPVGDPDRDRLEKLAKRAIERADEAEQLMAPAQAAVEAAKPQAEEAEKMLQRWGIEKEQIRSAKTRLKIEMVSAEAQRTLAQAAQNGGADSAKQLLAEAQEKVGVLKAQARAGQKIAETLPIDEGTADAEISLSSRQSRVDGAFTKLMADAQPAASEQQK